MEPTFISLDSSKTRSSLHRRGKIGLFQSLHFDSIGSTQDYAHELINRLDIDKTGPILITADYQSRGRGGYGHSWLTSRRENITATYLWSEQIDKYWRYEEIFSKANLTKRMEKIFSAMERFFAHWGLSVQVKWPNDILIGDAKISGILSEIRSKGSTQQVQVLGIGVNVNMTKEFAQQIDQKVTSIRLETNLKQDLKEVLFRLTKEITKCAE